LAVLVRIEVTSVAVRAGLADITRAATAAASGLANEVPLTDE